VKVERVERRCTEGAGGIWPAREVACY